MDRELHKAAMEGNYDDLMKRVDLFNDARTPNRNTVLHVATQFRHSNCVAGIIEKCPDLLYQVNSKGETALHIAASKGYVGENIVTALIDCAEKVEDPESAGGSNNTGGLLHQMLRAVNEDGNTALHLAAPLFCGNKLGRLLTEGDREFEHLPNKAQETPLYLACEALTSDMVSIILDNCRSPAYSGPDGKTALHAAVINEFDIFSRGGLVQLLLDRWPDLVREPDKHGWTPLHYAARANNIEAVSKLLKHDKSMAYIRTNNDENNTALHIAAAQEYTEVMEEIFLYCSDCWEVVNGKGQNIFHVAAKMEKNALLKFLKDKKWSKCLLNQKDNEGNTPLHLLASWTQKRSSFHLRDFMEGGNWAALNHKNLTPLDIALSNKVSFISKRQKGEVLKALVGSNSSTATNDPKNRRPYVIGWRNVVETDREKLKEKEKMTEEASIPAEIERFRKMADAHLIVAALVATVTFAAAFTLPGGYDSAVGKNQGTPILLKKVAFKIFIISDTIAVAAATGSVFLHVTASLYDDKANLLYRYRKAFRLILIAIVAMVLAFFTGIYVVLAPSLSLAIATCVIGSFSFLIFLRELRKMDFFRNSWFLMLDFFSYSWSLMVDFFLYSLFRMIVFFINLWFR